MSKIADLPNAPEWLKNATVTNENVEITDDGCVIWHGGTWYDGEWYGREWRYGAWHNGTWYHGVWHGGIWHNGAWYDGIWRGGQWYDGWWHDGVWLNGTWLNGTWHGGIWRNGTWHDGVWHDGIWQGGKWLDGEWLNGIWRDGTWQGGKWHGGIWHMGEWRSGKWLDPNISDRIAYMVTVAGIGLDGHGHYVGYRSVENDYSGRWDRTFKQELGDHRQEFEYDPKPGVCRKGIHVCSISTAYNYFIPSPTSRLIMVKFHRNDLIDCDGQKARIKGGVFTEVPWPWEG